MGHGRKQSKNLTFRVKMWMGRDVMQARRLLQHQIGECSERANDAALSGIHNGPDNAGDNIRGRGSGPRGLSSLRAGLG